MRILLAVRRWWPAVGGAETFTRALAYKLGRQHEVRVVAARVDSAPFDLLADGPGLPGFAPFDDGPVDIRPRALRRGDEIALMPLRLSRRPLTASQRVVIGRRTLTELYARVAARRLVTDARWADVVHVVGLIPGAAAGVRAARMAQRPVVLTPLLHGGFWADDRASAAVYRQVDRLLALQEPEAADLRRLGIPDDRIDITGACIDDAEPPGVEARAAQLRRDVGAGDHPIILHVGARLPHKGSRLMVDVARRLRTPAVVVLAGPGALSQPRGSGGARLIDVESPDDVEMGA